MIPRDELERALGASDPELRRRATLELGGLDEGDGTPLLLRALGDDDWRVRKEATHVLVKLGASTDRVAALVRVLGPGDNVGLRNAAVEALAGMGTVARSAVVEALGSLDHDGRKLAAEVLGQSGDPGAVASLVMLLDDADPNVALAAIDGLAEVGPFALADASGSLLPLLERTDVSVQLAALEALNRLGVVVPSPTLARMIRDPILRRAALVAVARGGQPSAAAVLGAALDDEARPIFRAAMAGLAELIRAHEAAPEVLRTHLGVLGPRATTRLVEALGVDTDAETRRSAILVAALAGEPAAIDPAIDALVDDAAAREARVALRLFGASAQRHVLARVAHGDAAIRAALIELLAELGAAGAPRLVHDALRGAMNDLAPEVSAAALAALPAVADAGDLGAVAGLVESDAPRVAAAAQTALALLARHFPDEARSLGRLWRGEGGMRLATAILIGALAGGVLASVDEEVAFLAAVVSSASPRGRMAAVAALAELGTDRGLEALDLALSDEVREIQLASVRALGRVGAGRAGAAALGRLLELIARSTDPYLVSAAVRALGDCQDPRGVAVLAPLVRSASASVAVAAIEALGRSRDPRRVDPLLDAAGSADVELAKAALLALDGVKDPRVRSRLGIALDHAAWHVRRLAADALGRFGGEPAVELLRGRLGREHEPLVREAIERALGALGSPMSIRRPSTMFPKVSR